MDFDEEFLWTEASLLSSIYVALVERDIYPQAYHPIPPKRSGFTFVRPLGSQDVRPATEISKEMLLQLAACGEMSTTESPVNWVSLD